MTVKIFCVCVSNNFFPKGITGETMFCLDLKKKKKKKVITVCYSSEEPLLYISHWGKVINLKVHHVSCTTRVDITEMG